MKRLFLFLFSAILFSACGTKSTGNESGSSEEAISVENLVEVTFSVEGMTCDGCENAIMKSVESLEGIAEVNSSHEEGWTKVSYDKSVADVQEIEQKIADAGYTVTGLRE